MWMVWAGLVMATGGASAADPVDPFSEPDEAALFRAEERVVTVASRYAQPVEKASSVITVLTARELRERGYRTLADALSSIPGIFITASKEGRHLAWIRGLSSDDNNKFLLLVDGVPWADGVYSHAWIDEYLPFAVIQQIEVIQGPGSAMYGSSAFGGVINVVTYGPSDFHGGFVRAEAGSFSRRGLAVVGGDRLELGEQVIGVRAYARSLTLDGDGLSTTPSGEANASGESPRDALGAGLAVELGGISLRYDHVDFHHSPLVVAENDPLDVDLHDPDRYGYRYHNDFFAAKGDIGIGRVGRLSPYLYLQRYDNPGLYGWVDDPELRVDAEGTSSVSSSMVLVAAEKITDHYGLGLEAELYPAIGHVTVLGVGAEANRLVKLEDQVYLDGASVPTTTAFSAPRALLADSFAFVQHQWSAAWWLELNAGARLDNRGYLCLQTRSPCTLPEAMVFGSPRLGVTLIPDGVSTIKLLYGRAFRAPNARELLVTVGVDDAGANLATASNLKLRPEVIDTVETEVAVAPVAGVKVRADVFASRVRDQVEKVSVALEEAGELGDISYQNIGGMDAFGVEAEARWTAGSLDLALSYAWTHAVDTDSGRVEYGFPPHMGHGRASWAVVDGLRLTLLGDAYSAWPQAAWSPAAGLADGEPVALAHVALAADRLARGHVRVDLSVRNVLDTRYFRPLSPEVANAVDGDGEAVYPYGLEGEGRMAVVGLELSL